MIYSSDQVFYFDMMYIVSVVKRNGTFFKTAIATIIALYDMMHLAFVKAGAHFDMYLFDLTKLDLLASFQMLVTEHI